MIIGVATVEQDHLATDEAFAAACDREKARLLVLARDVLRNEGEAQDVVLDTLEIAWRSRESLRDSARVGAWLTRICVRRSLRVRHTRLLRRRAEWIHVELPGRGVDGGDPDLHRAVSRLSAQQRAVIVLHYRDGYTLDECAQVVGCKPGTVRQHLHRALQRLRKELEHGH